jgi:hypothetical protein
VAAFMGDDGRFVDEVEAIKDGCNERATQYPKAVSNRLSPLPTFRSTPALPTPLPPSSCLPRTASSHPA